MLLLLALILQAEPAQVQKPPDPPAVSVDRVKRELERPAALGHLPPLETPVFRVRVRERGPYERLWEEHSTTPAYVRQSMPAAHYDLLAKVTPEEFRAATLYPCCVDLVPVFESVGDQVRQARRSQAQSRAKSTVRKDFLKLEIGKKPDDR
jgi:hypothetical protein